MTKAPQAVLSPLPAFLRQPATAAVLAALPEARAVGGSVRDALADRPVHDVDVAVPLPPEAVTQRLRAAGLKVFETGLQHGTVTAVLDHHPVEVTSLRRDVATDGRHAEVEWTTDWREDAARRDFTINAMSLTADGELFDYFSGREDLARGLVRFVGDPATRLAEDYLRAMRFFRFWARYGRGEPDPAAIAAIRAAVPGLARLSAERVWMELKRLLATATPCPALALMAGSGVLGAVLPAAAPPALDALEQAISAGLPADPVLRLAVLLPPAGQGAGARVARALRFSTEERDTLLRLHDQPPALPAEEECARRRWLALLGKAEWADHCAWLAEARGAGSQAALRDWVAATPVPEFPLLGRDAMALGVTPGPRIGALLAAARQWWLAGGCIADRAACLERLRELAVAAGV